MELVDILKIVPLLSQEIFLISRPISLVLALTWFIYCISQVGGVTANQMNVYEEFAKSIPGFLPPEATGAPEPFPKPLQEQIPGLFGGSTQESAVCIDNHSEN